MSLCHAPLNNPIPHSNVQTNSDAALFPEFISMNVYGQTHLNYFELFSLSLWRDFRKFRSQDDLLVLSREWMGMGEWDDYS